MNSVWKSDRSMLRYKSWRATTAVLFPLLILNAAAVTTSTLDLQPCDDDSDCNIADGLQCIDEFCINPFAIGGCLKQNKKDWAQVRVCNSEDPPNAAELGFCVPPDGGLDYTEIRILAQNWESPVFNAWVLQIFLTEVLEVPVSLETGVLGKSINFYDPNAKLEMGVAYDWDAFRRANHYGDCRKVPMKDGKRQTCAHVVTEVWERSQELRDLASEGVIEPAQALGSIGEEYWYIPKFTALQDPTLTSYLGMTGEHNRKKLAETFLTPATWRQYCEEVSQNNCTTDDGIAKRAPLDAEENDRMFAEDFYTGHFRATFQNNCTINPNCTGHFADYPCGWGSYSRGQAYHNNIALEPGNGQYGYKYSQLVEMWSAANATRSNLIALWWRPEAMYQKYLGTDTEQQKVSLPPPTQDCFENRIDPNIRCSGDYEAIRGDPRGACDYKPQTIRKAIATSLNPYDEDDETPKLLRSPAYDAINAFAITELQFGKFADYWIKDRNSTRTATCRWVVENLDLLRSFAPKSYPRVLEEAVFKGMAASYSLAGLAIALAIGASLVTYLKRNTKVMRCAQVDFLWLVHGGILMVTVGALVTAVPPSDATCVVSLWLVSLGYTLLLVPLIVKVFAINKMLQAAESFRRVRLQRSHLYGAVVVIDLLLIIFLIVWTVVDPPKHELQYELSGSVTSRNETIVSVHPYCGSSHPAWNGSLLAWNFIIILVAAVLAFMSRRIPSDFRETQTLAMLIYSNFLFAVLRALFTFLSLNENGPGWNETDGDPS